MIKINQLVKKSMNQYKCIIQMLNVLKYNVTPIRWTKSQKILKKNSIINAVNTGKVDYYFSSVFIILTKKKTFPSFYVSF